MKTHFLLLIALLVSTITFAQITPSFGVRAGVSSAGMRGDAVNNLQNMIDFAKGNIATRDRTGFFVGGYANIPLTDILSVEPGLYYSQKGYQMVGSFGLKGLDFLGANAKAKLNLNYIDLPVVLKANFNGFQVFGGPQFSYLSNANLTTTAGILGFNLLNKKMDASSEFNKWDAGLTAGIGYKLSSGLNLTASYDYGLTKVDANRSFNSYNRGIKVGIGMSF
jgi:hypothetical protein